MQDPSASNEETDGLLAKQFTTLGACLGDEAPALRAEAVGGICRLLDLFWEVIPAATSAAFLKRLTGAHAARRVALMPTVMHSHFRDHLHCCVVLNWYGP